MADLSDKPKWFGPIYAVTLINAWYAALNLHLAEKGTLTDQDRIAILARVRSQCRDMELYMENEGNQPFCTRDLMKKFEKIAMFSARSQI
ncbi:MAG: hypothetical protein AB7S77_11960 [Desulfatirhabdiaceae bacterium]